MPWGKVTFREHLNHLADVGSWGTPVDLQAVSDRFNTTVFVCSPNPSGIIRRERKVVAYTYRIRHDLCNVSPKNAIMCV